MSLFSLVIQWPNLFSSAFRIQNRPSASPASCPLSPSSHHPSLPPQDHMAPAFRLLSVKTIFRLAAWKWKSLRRFRLFAIPGTPWSSPGQNTGVGCHAFLRGSSQPRDWTQVSCIWADSLPSEPPGKPMNTGVGSLSLLQGIFLTQELNRGILHCRQILYQLSYQGSLTMYGP